MTHESLLNELWQATLTQLGGAAAIEASARETRAFLRGRAVKCATDLLRLILAYCLGGMGLRSTSVWAASAGLADLSNVALLKRLRNCGAWMEHLVGKLLVAGAAPAAGGRRIRLLDGTTVPKAGKEARENNGLWRLHCTFDLPAERFSFIELTDEKSGERLDRTPVAKGDILIADRGFMHPGPLAHVLEQGADIVVRTGWKGARWLDESGKPFDILAALAAAGNAGVLDRPIWVARKKAAPLALRLVAFRKPPEAAEASRTKARAAAKREGYAISGGTLAAAEWLILVTSLDAKTFSTNEIGEFYRARWRIEMAFKRLKSIVGLSGPPGEDPQIAKTWILAHLLMILLLEPQISAPAISPRMAA
jgi:Transposase DDE domain